MAKQHYCLLVPGNYPKPTTGYLLIWRSRRSGNLRLKFSVDGKTVARIMFATQDGAAMIELGKKKRDKAWKGFFSVAEKYIKIFLQNEKLAERVCK